MLKRTVKILFIVCGVTMGVVGDVMAVDFAQDIVKNYSLKKGGEDSPVKITSKTVSLNANTRVFEYSGDVVVTKDDLEIKSNTMAGTYSDKNKLETIIFKDNVTMTNGADMSAKADRAQYDVLGDTITMTGSPEIIDRGNKLSADKIVVHVKDRRSEAQGNVRVDFVNKPVQK